MCFFFKFQNIGELALSFLFTTVFWVFCLLVFFVWLGFFFEQQAKVLLKSEIREEEARKALFPERRRPKTSAHAAARS